MALRNYEIVMVYSLANGEEAVEALKQKFTDLIAKHGTLGNVEDGVSASLHIQSTMKTMAIM
jgi:small subunit ribosomal protein S6